MVCELRTVISVLQPVTRVVCVCVCVCVCVGGWGGVFFLFKRGLMRAFTVRIV
jgi:hypothetical protein